MKWIEIFELRLAGSDSENVMKELKQIVKEIKSDSEYKSLKLYVHVNVESDFSMHIIHETEEIIKTGSASGLIILSKLKTYGFVNYGIWRELTVNEPDS